MEVISSSFVGMAAANANANPPISKLDPTPWDLFFLLLDPIQKGILFHKPERESQQNLIAHLKTSLSRTLLFFPPLAGRFGTVQNDDSTTSYFIDCNNAGAGFTHSVAHDVSISDILEPKYIPEMVSSFFPLNGIPNFEGVSNPLLAVQITELTDGLFIACTMNHAVADGTSFWHFFNSWAEISRGLGIISRSPVLERWFPNSVKLSIHLPPLEKKLPNKSVSPPLVERAFSFSKESLGKLKGKANSEAGTTKISSLQALMAHLWRSAIRCGWGKKSNHNLENHNFLLVVGARARIPLAETYFGNAIYFVKIGASEAELVQNELGYCGLKINQLVSEQNGEAAIKYVDDWLKNPTVVGKKELSSFIVSSSPRHDVYGCDFGWGKPITVRSGKGQKFDGKMTVFPAAVAGGIDVEVCLAPVTMAALEMDPEFMETVLM